jgi:hypothetical protein
MDIFINMKNTLTKLSIDEKKKILEQHKGGKKIVIENFNKLINNKLGTVNPLIVEQKTDDERFTSAGYRKVGEINLPDGTYEGNPTGYEKVASPANLNYVSDLHIYDKSGKPTGYAISLKIASRSGYDNVDVVIAEKKPNQEGDFYFKELGYKPTEREMINSSADIPQSLVDGAAPNGKYVSGGKNPFFELIDTSRGENGSKVFRISSVNSDFNFGNSMEGLIEAERNSFILSEQESDGYILKVYFNDGQTPADQVVKKSNDSWIGFYSKANNVRFGCFTLIDGTFGCRKYGWYHPKK